jgi:2,4-dienoyl-CoA reductase-like NADH-dependent reductase (Old Yellow Enzyme family)
MAAQPHLFSSGRIDTMALRYWIVMSPMEDQFATEIRLPAARAITNLAAHTRGGVSLITISACYFDSQHNELPSSLHLGSSDVVEAPPAFKPR